MMISLDKIDIRGLTLDRQCDSIAPKFWGSENKRRALPTRARGEGACEQLAFFFAEAVPRLKREGGYG